MSPTSPMPGQLFGVSLPDICENDNLPKPILVSVIWVCKLGGKDVSEGEVLQVSLSPPALTKNLYLTSEYTSQISSWKTDEGDVVRKQSSPLVLKEQQKPTQIN